MSKRWQGFGLKTKQHWKHRLGIQSRFCQAQSLCPKEFENHGLPNAPANISQSVPISSTRWPAGQASQM
jgi:hypothetical protein